jgi:hypothetical protein
MQVFTTIYLGEILKANVQLVQETPGLDLSLPGVSEFAETLLRKVAQIRRSDLETGADENRVPPPIA